MMRYITIVAASLVAALVGAASAAAERPAVLEKQNTLTRLFPENPDCRQYGYEFTFSERFEVVRTVTEFLDNAGTVTRRVLHVRFVGTATNDETGKAIDVDGQRHLVFDFRAQTFTETGVLRHVTAPGAGIVLHDSGRIVLPLEGEEPLFEAGPHELLHGDLAGYCAALA